jgi:hypothetical protein
MNIIRDHDKLYLKENRYKKPKEIFKSVYNLIKKYNLEFMSINNF